MTPLPERVDEHTEAGSAIVETCMEITGGKDEEIDCKPLETVGELLNTDARSMGEACLRVGPTSTPTLLH
ncbi:MAG: hypothetical protein QXH45_07130 [Thermosphaera sp.]